VTSMQMPRKWIGLPAVPRMATPGESIVR
jgi:hypothetical protein